MCNLHVYALQGHHRYGMILGHEILSKLNIYLRFSYNTVIY